MVRVTPAEKAVNKHLVRAQFKVFTYFFKSHSADCTYPQTELSLPVHKDLAHGTGFQCGKMKCFLTKNIMQAIQVGNKKYTEFLLYYSKLCSLENEQS